jgi:SAM-dependent methyltransferase
MADKNRSIHISYSLREHERRGHSLRQGLCALAAAAAADGAPPSQVSVLDAGCGLGLLGRDLAERGFGRIVGLDSDPTCVGQAQEYMSCVLGDVTDVSNLFQPRSFDVVVLSHVLEHMQRPVEVVESLLSVSKRWLIIAVPNPTRLQVVLKLGFLGRDYANRGHLFSWDKSHLTRFLENGCGLRIHQWASDGVRVLPGRVRELLPSVIDRVETTVLPKYLPALSTSLMVLCEKGTGTTDGASQGRPRSGAGPMAG